MTQRLSESFSASAPTVSVLRGRGNRPCTASSTQMSSSSSSQRSARPCKRSWTFSSRFCGALASRGYLEAGKLVCRWSESSSQTRWPSIQQRRATASLARSVSMKANIRRQQRLAMLFNQPLDFAQFRWAKTQVSRERNRLQPELGFDVLARDVDVRRFVSFAAVKMKSIRADAQYRWHERTMNCASRNDN
jgi:hypothetical protein